MNAGRPDVWGAAPVARGRSGEPRLGAVASWVVLAASFGLSASTWIAIATVAGFSAGVSVPVPDVGLVVTLRLAWLMPVAVDGYVVVVNFTTRRVVLSFHRCEEESP